MPHELLGHQVGNYRIERPLGFGAMGHVYFAQHVVMGRRAAVKVLNRELSADEVAVERFVTEARAVNDIRHPNIVEVTDFGKLDEQYYLIMELLEGETLEECLSQCGTLAPDEVVHIGSQIASALQAAHEHGFLHRDLKPSNIFLTHHPDYPNHVKVLDFGVTKLLQQTKQQKAERRTQTGAIVGTPHYMSPEQCLGEAELGPQSDVYALGVVLYELLTGELPFDANNLSKLLLAHLNDVPRPLRELDPAIPETFEAVVLRALHKDGSQRFSSMRAMRDSLRAALQRSSAPAAAPESPAAPEFPQQPEPLPVLDEGQPDPAAAAQALPQPILSAQEQATAPTLEHSAPEPAQAAMGLCEEDAQRSRRVSGRMAQIVAERLQAGTLVLPTMPAVAVDCLGKLRDSRVGFTEIGRTLERDPLLTAQVLRAANSAAYTSSTRASTLDQAISRLGGRRLNTLLIELSARRVFQSRDARIRKAFNSIWEHSLAVAILARALALQLDDAASAESAYLAGLLHDVGKPTVAGLLLEAERTLSARDLGFMTEDLWLRVVDESHREVGGVVVESWKMPRDVVDSVSRCGDYRVERPRSIVNYVTYANAVAECEGFAAGSEDGQAARSVVQAGESLLGLEAKGRETLTGGLGEKVSGRTGEYQLTC